ncbi:MAG: class I SAM-dependent methyltransferase [Proteobacteria bacterium]|nr:class I SAM-dependent methyltransferase [Pseudomonadota bacterium]
MSGWRVGARRLRMGLATLLGRPRGFFTPYRYAGAVERPGPYPAIEAAFRAAEPSFAGVLDEIDAHGERLAGFDGPPPEPRWGQSWFPRLDGAAAYALVRRHAPGRIIEVGSGHSTRMLVRAAADAGAGTRITCIDPAPRAALRGLEIAWRERVLGVADLALFEALEPGDMAFFDSSHILWPGTDVDMMLNRILPLLAPGVLVHIHDILLPDPYPREWDWRGYTEQNGLAGWILGGGCEAVFSSHYALTRMGAARRPGIAGLALPEGAFETSLWLRRV